MAVDKGVRAEVDWFVYFSSLLLEMLAVTAFLPSQAPGGNLSCTASHVPGSGSPFPPPLIPPNLVRVMGPSPSELLHPVCFCPFLHLC